MNNYKGKKCRVLEVGENNWVDCFSLICIIVSHSFSPIGVWPVGGLGYS